MKSNKSKNRQNAKSQGRKFKNSCPNFKKKFDERVKYLTKDSTGVVND